MTEIFKAGEHVKIVKSDSGYDDTLGDQTGLVGTISNVAKSGGWVEVQFPHTGSKDYTYYPSEVERAGTPAPEKEYRFRKGDKVRFVRDNPNWIGAEYTVREDVEENGDWATVPLAFTKVPDTLRDYVVGSIVGLPAFRVELIKPIAKGDWVKVVGYHEAWDGTVGEVTEVYTNNVTIVNDTHTLGLGFPLKNVKPTEKPVVVFKKGDRVEFIEDYNGDQFIGDAGTVTHVEAAAYKGNGYLLEVDMDKGGDTSVFAFRLKLSDKPKPVPAPKYKVGDWVQVGGYGNLYDGTVGQVTLRGNTNPYVYVIKLHEHKKGHATGGFDEKYLTPADEPFKPKFKVGDWVKVTGWTASYNGRVYQIKSVPVDRYSYYRFESAPGVGFTDQYLEATEKPFIAKFEVGDWVEVTNCCSATGCTGSKAQIKAVPSKEVGYYTLDRTDGGFTDYREEQLTATAEPFTPKFKIGDWVKVEYAGDWRGLVGQVTELPDRVGGYTRVKHPTEEGRTGVFIDPELTLTTEPEEPHWTETAPLHSSVRIGGRTIVKIGADQWLFVYHDGSYSEKVASSIIRSNEDTRGVFGNEPLRYELTKVDA